LGASRFELLRSQLDLAIEAFDDGCASGYLPIATAHPIIQGYAAAFLGLHVADALTT
jgi:hypothetical protein